MNLKSLMDNLGLKSLNAQPGQVIPNPYVRAFAPQPSVKEEVVNEEDHEVSMAQNQLDSIIKNATELKGKIGEMEKNIPGWIQDHITNSENYIEQANTGYHELEESLNEEFKHIIHVDTPTQVVSKPIAAQILALAKKGVRSKDIGLEMGFVGNQKLATDAFQKVKNKIYFELGKKNELVNEGLSKDSIVRTLTSDKNAYFLTKDGNGWILDITPKGAQNSTFHQKFTVKDMGKGHLGMKYRLSESVNEAVDIKDGKYRFYSKDGVGYLTYAGKEISSGDFDWDDGSNSYWMSHSSFKGSQKAFDTGKDVINYFKSKKITTESVNEARLTDIVNSIVETPVIGKMIRTEAKKYDIGSGWMGNGLTIWNRAEEEHGDYKIIAHISPDGKLSIRDKQLPSDIKKMFQTWADTMKKGDRPGIY